MREQVHWWGYPAWQTWPARAMIWFMVAISIPCLLIPLPWIAIPIAFLLFAWLWARTSAVAIGLDGEHLYLRRLFLGRVEQIPLTEVRRCLVLRGLLQTRLRIHGPWRLWLTMAHRVLPGGRVPDWDGLLDALRVVFEPQGKWEDLTRWWW